MNFESCSVGIPDQHRLPSSVPLLLSSDEVGLQIACKGKGLKHMDVHKCSYPTVQKFLCKQHAQQN